jgi:hypothetical protein
MTKFVDLDKIVGADIRVQVGGVKYVLPGDMPADLYLEVNRRAQEGDESDYEAIRGLHERVLDLFRHKQPDLESIPGLTLRQLFLAVGEIYGPDDGDQEDAEASKPVRPRPRKSSGGATSSKSRTARTRPRR